MLKFSAAYVAVAALFGFALFGVYGTAAGNSAYTMMGQAMLDQSAAITNTSDSDSLASRN